MIDYNWSEFLTGVLTAFLIYTFPILIYRFAIRKLPFDRRKAAIISGIYSFAAFVIVTVIKNISGNASVSGAWIFWGFADYLILIHGWDRQFAEWKAQQRAEVRLKQTVVENVKSILMDYGMSVSKDATDDFHDDLNLALHETEDRTILSNDPEILKTTYFVIIKTCIKTLMRRAKDQNDLSAPSAVKIYDLCRDSLKWYKENGYISEEAYTTYQKKIREAMHGEKP